MTEADVTLTPDEPRFRDLYAGEQMTVEGVDYRRVDEGGLVWLTHRIRQLGVVDVAGRAATHTGERTFDWSGSIVGDGFCCQGNLLAGESVVVAMAEAYVRSRPSCEHLPGRLLAAIEAGDEAGGDRRGKQAAGMLVVRDGGHWTGSDRWCDIRVDDHSEPVVELGRLLRKVGFVES